MDTLIILLSRLGFASLLLFQVFNLVGFSKMKPDFSWEGLITTSLFVWITVEIVYWYLRPRSLTTWNIFHLTFISSVFRIKIFLQGLPLGTGILRRVFGENFNSKHIWHKSERKMTQVFNERDLKKVKIDGPLYPLFLIALIPTAIDTMGDSFGLYSSLSPWFDKMMHLVGSASVVALSFFVLHRLKNAERIKWSLRLMLFISFSVGMIGGILYEIEEHLEDLLYWKKQVRLGDGPDTVDDIIFNIIGALIVVGTIWVFKWIKNRNHRSWP